MSFAAHSLYPAATGARAANVSYLGAARCRRKFELFYPDGFHDEVYLIAERAAKERAHLEWRCELDPVQFRKLIARGEYRHIADTAIRIESRVNLLFSFEKMALRDALKSPAGARLFAHELDAFLHARGSHATKFRDWAAAVAELPRTNTRVLTWPMVTCWGFIARPERHLFFKPRATRKAAADYGFDLQYKPTPDWAGYDRLLTFAAIIRRDLQKRAGFKARDMIDLHSFIWVQGAAEYEA